MSVSYCFWDILRRALEIYVTDRSRSLKTALYYTTAYWSAIVNIAPSCTIFKLFDVKECCNLEISDRNHSRSSEISPFDRSHTSSYSSSIVIMVISCTISEIKRDNGWKLRFFHTPSTQELPGQNGCHYFALIFTTKPCPWMTEQRHDMRPSKSVSWRRSCKPTFSKPQWWNLA